MDDPRIEKLPDYECAATGQDHYKTFDARSIIFHTNTAGCEYTLMEIKGTKHHVKVSNQECGVSFELLMCKKVVITTEYGTVELFQKYITITDLVGKTTVIPPGMYPEPCHYSILKYTEIFSEGLYTIVRVFDPNDRFIPLYMVSRYFYNTNISNLQGRD